MAKLQDFQKGDIFVRYKPNDQHAKMVRGWLRTAVIGADIWDLSEMDMQAETFKSMIKKASCVISDDKDIRLMADALDIPICPIEPNGFLVSPHKMQEWLQKNVPLRTPINSNRVVNIDSILPVKRKKILLVIPYYHKEEDAVRQLLGVMCAMLDHEKPSPYMNIMLAARADTKIDYEWVKGLNRYFEKVHQFTCARATEIGWPIGPNAMFHEILSEVYRLVRDRVEDVDAFFLNEADTCPLQVDWQKQLQNEWYSGTQLVLGCEMKHCAQHNKHINGNAVYDARLMAKVQGVYGCAYNEAYDVVHYPKWARQAKASRLIFNDWGRKTITKEMLYEGKKFHAFPQELIVPTIYHGVKDNSARDIVTDKFKLTYPRTFA